MTQIMCPLFDCINWEDGICTAERIRLSREGYCLTFKISEDDDEETDWTDDEDLELEDGADEDWEDEWEDEWDDAALEDEEFEDEEL